MATGSDEFDIAVVGGGIIGVATATAILDRWPGQRVVVLEKEHSLAAHQTGRNSGVVHSGLYYKPGSLKATLCVAGNASITQFCADHGVPYERCGKLVVASSESEFGRLQALTDRATASGIAFRNVERDEIAEIERHVVGERGLWIPSTGITDYRRIVEVLAEIVQQRDGAVRLGTEVVGVRRQGDRHVVDTTTEPVRARLLVNCAGLQSDRIARLSGAELKPRIVPFRGEYFELAEHSRSLVRGLVYPVPDPHFPFLGVHFTRMIDGSVHAGPNAVLALAREGYRKRDIVLRDVRDVATFPGFWRLAAKHWRPGLAEVARSMSKRLFLRSLQRLIPDLGLGDLVPSQAGVRAQLLEPSGALVDDFKIVRSDRAVHVCNAPSPAATSSLEIGKMIANELASSISEP